MGVGDVERRVKVDEVADERAGGGADDDDGGDDGRWGAKVRAGCGGLHLEEEASFGVEHHSG